MFMCGVHLATTRVSRTVSTLGRGHESLVAPALSASTLPAADALAAIYGPVARMAAFLVTAASALAVLHATVLLAPRILYGMSRDGLFKRVGMYVTHSGSAAGHAVDGNGYSSGIHSNG